MYSTGPQDEKGGQEAADWGPDLNPASAQGLDSLSPETQGGAQADAGYDAGVGPAPTPRSGQSRRLRGDGRPPLANGTQGRCVRPSPGRHNPSRLTVPSGAFCRKGLRLCHGPVEIRSAVELYVAPAALRARDRGGSNFEARENAKAWAEAIVFRKNDG